MINDIVSMNFEKSEELVNHLELDVHIEGGFYRETYRSKNVIETKRGLRNEMTSIYYCLPSNDFSVWHKIIDAEETFHYHYGDSSLIYKIIGREIITEVLGPKKYGKESITMPANTWFAIRPSGLKKPADYSLMSCVVVPGFEFEDLVIADRSILKDLDQSMHKLAESLLKSEYKTEGRAS